MMEVFNNRETSIALWSTIFLGWALWQKKIRFSIIELVKSFFRPKIAILFIFLLIYSVFVVILLRDIGIWNLSNLKDTIYWFIFSGAIIAFRTITDEATEKPIRKQVKDLFSFAIILEFIVNTYIFRLFFEIIFVQFIVVLTSLYTYASIKAEYKRVQQILGTLLAIIGITMFIQALIEMFRNLNEFGRFDTLIDIALPVILTLSILPAIYLLILYISYESLFARLNIIFDSIDKQRYVKKLLILQCGFRIVKVRYMLRRRVNMLYDSASEKDIRRILLNREIQTS